MRSVVGRDAGGSVSEDLPRVPGKVFGPETGLVELIGAVGSQVGHKLAHVVIACGPFGCGECLLELGKDFRLDVVEKTTVVARDSIEVQSCYAHLDVLSRISCWRMSCERVRGKRAR